MQIPQLKLLLSILDVLAHVGLKPNGRGALRCPFHESSSKKVQYTMQVYTETNTVYCFNINCPTHGHSLDVIAFVGQYYTLGDHEAIMKCKRIIHDLGRWPLDILNPFTTQNEEPILPPVAVHPPMKTTEKKTDQKEKEEANDASKQPGESRTRYLPQLKRNEYGQLCLLHESLQIHLLAEPDVKSLNSLRVGLLIKKQPHTQATEVVRQGTIDLYQYEGLQKFIKRISEKLQLALPYTTEVFALFTELLENYVLDKRQQRDKERQLKEAAAVLPPLSNAQEERLKNILYSKDLLAKINELIGLSGIVGEEANRIFLFTILSSYKLPQPLSALLQGGSGSGKTSLFAGVLQYFPPRDVYNSTRITDGSLYNFGEYELMFKILANEDLDGLSLQALFALRELVSKGFIVSSTTIKDEEGNIKSVLIKVYGPVSFVGCTTKAELYEDNMGRVFTIAVDESIEQTKRIIQYQNKKSAGKINKEEQAEAILILQHLVQKLQPVEVINPYAEMINLPDETHQLRRLNALFKIYIEQVTRLHQYGLKPDGKGVYYTTKQHIQLAADNFFECIVLKCDELNGEIRKFYEWLKEYITKEAKKKGQSPKEYRFTQREVRQACQKSKASISNYMQSLMELEYISSTGGNQRTVMYQVGYWDDHGAMRSRLKSFIQEQIAVMPEE